MTPPSYTGPRTIADRFELLKQDGWPPAEAVEILSLMYLGGHFHTSLRSFGPPFLGFRLGPNEELIVYHGEDEFVPGKIPTRDPDASLDPTPVPFTLPVIEFGAEHDRLLKAAMVSTKPRTIGQLLAANPSALKNADEARAAEWLAPKLTPDDEVTRETYRDDCMKEFKTLSEVGYADRVWYAARWLAELPRERKSGAPKGPRKAGTFEKSRKNVPKK